MADVRLPLALGDVLAAKNFFHRKPAGIAALFDRDCDRHRDC
jgi:hypothetical protein